MQPSTATTEQEGHLKTNFPAESLANADNEARRDTAEGLSDCNSTDAQATGNTTVVLTTNSARKHGEKGQKALVANGGARKGGGKKGGNGREIGVPRGRDGYSLAARQHHQHQQPHLLDYDSSREKSASPLTTGTPTAAAVSHLVDDQITNLPHIRGHSHNRSHERHHCCIKSSSRDGTNTNANESKQALLDHVPCPYSPPSPLFPISKLKQRFKRILKQRYPDHVPDYIVRAGPVDAASAAGELIMCLILCYAKRC